MKPRVFISYSHADSEFVEWLAAGLSAAEIDVWIDKWEIKVGESITARVNAGISGSDSLILVLSKHSVSSKWVMEELNAASVRNIERDRGAFILPALIEECSIPLLLKHRKYVDFRSDRQRALEELTAAITSQSIDDLSQSRLSADSDTNEIMAKLSADSRRTKGLYPSKSQSRRLYLQARQQWDIRNPRTIKSSIRSFELAAQCDPHYALPLVGMSEAYIIAVAHGIIPPEIACPQAKASAKRALDVNPNLGEPFASLAFLSVSFDKDWNNAWLWLKRAQQLSPDYFFTHNALAYVSITSGNIDRAILALDKAARFAPFSLSMRVLQGDAHYLVGEPKKAMSICAGLSHEFPNSVLAHVCLGLACTGAGDHKRAIREHDMAVRIGKGNPQYVGFLGFAYAAGGNTNKAKEILGQLYKRSRTEYVPQYSMALLNIGIGDYHTALAHLEQGYANHDHWLSFALVDPKLDPLRKYQRFTQLLSRFRVPK